MKSLAIAAALLCGCATVHQHPFATALAGNAALTVGAGVCAIECGGDVRRAADGVLIGELALASALTGIVIEVVAAYAAEKH